MDAEYPQSLFLGEIPSLYSRQSKINAFSNKLNIVFSLCIWKIYVLYYKVKFWNNYFHRFAPTRPPVHWSGVRECTSHAPVCPQTFQHINNMTEALQKMPMRWLQFLRKVKPKLSQQSEDCLHLNIFVPKDGKKAFFHVLKINWALYCSGLIMIKVSKFRFTERETC